MISLQTSNKNLSIDAQNQHLLNDNVECVSVKSLSGWSYNLAAKALHMPKELPKQDHISSGGAR